MIDTAGEPMCVARAPWLDVDLDGVRRFESLLFPAIDQALGPLRDASVSSSRLALALALPGPRIDLVDSFHSELLTSVEARFRGRFTTVAAFPCGHAAGLLPLEPAVRKLVDVGWMLVSLPELIAISPQRRSSGWSPAISSMERDC